MHFFHTEETVLVLQIEVWCVKLQRKLYELNNAE